MNDSLEYSRKATHTKKPKKEKQKCVHDLRHISTFITQIDTCRVFLVLIFWSFITLSFCYFAFNTFIYGYGIIFVDLFLIFIVLWHIILLNSSIFKSIENWFDSWASQKWKHSYFLIGNMEFGWLFSNYGVYIIYINCKISHEYWWINGYFG